MNNMKIRSPILKDLESISRLSWIMAQERTDIFRSGVSAESLKDTLGRAIERGDPMNLSVAEINGEYAGHVNISTYSERASHVGEINIGLLPDFRGRGIGSKLLKKALKRAKQIGLEILLASTFSSNLAAIKLFQKFGFEEVGRIKRYVKFEDGTYTDRVVFVYYLANI